MTSESTQSKLTLVFDLDSNVSDISDALRAIEATQWTAYLLTEPALLFLRHVRERFSEIDTFFRRHHDEDIYRLLSKSPSFNLDKDELDALEEFIDGGGIRRPSFMSDLAWDTTKWIAQQTKATISAIRREELHKLVRIFGQPILPDSAQQESRYPRLSPPRVANLLLDQIRVQLTPKVSNIAPGSIVVTIVAAGGPILLGIAGVLTARSMAKKNNSEAGKAHADALKSRAEASYVDAQSVKVIAEAEKVRAETAELHLRLIQEAFSSRNLPSQEQQVAINQVLLKLAEQSNPEIATLFRETAIGALYAAREEIHFFGRHLKRAEVEDQ